MTKKKKETQDDKPGISFMTQNDKPVLPQEVVVNALCNTCGCTEFTILRDNSIDYNAAVIHTTRVQCNNCQNVYIVRWSEADESA